MAENNFAIETNISAEKEKLKNEIYDIIIIGSGIAGATCAIYAARRELKVLLVESKIPGGQITTSDLVENFPTHLTIKGIEIGLKLKEQTDSFKNITSLWDNVIKINKLDTTFVIKTAGEKTFYGKTLVMASGADPKELGIPGEKEFRGRGVSYCATCDGAFYRNKEVVVIGGGDAAVKEALYLAKIAKKVYIVHRRNKLRAEQIIAAQAAAHPKIEIIWNTIAEKITGEGNQLSGLQLKNVVSGTEKFLFCDGIFIYVGVRPNTELVKELAKLTEDNYLAAGEDTKTSLPGLFAAGDIRVKPLRQLVTAAADGATAAMMAAEYLENHE